MSELRRLLTAEQDELKKKEQDLEMVKKEKELEISALRLEVKEMEKAQTSMEHRLEEERKTAMEVKSTFVFIIYTIFFFKSQGMTLNEKDEKEEL